MLDNTEWSLYFEGFVSTDSIEFGAALYSRTTFFKILSIKTIIPEFEFGINMSVFKNLFTPFENECVEEALVFFKIEPTTCQKQPSFRLLL